MTSRQATLPRCLMSLDMFWSWFYSGSGQTIRWHCPKLCKNSLPEMPRQSKGGSGAAMDNTTMYEDDYVECSTKDPIWQIAWWLPWNATVWNLRFLPQAWWWPLVTIGDHWWPLVTIGDHWWPCWLHKWPFHGIEQFVDNSVKPAFPFLIWYMIF